VDPPYTPGLALTEAIGRDLCTKAERNGGAPGDGAVAGVRPPRPSTMVVEAQATQHAGVGRRQRQAARAGDAGRFEHALLGQAHEFVPGL
jgi:hypothetical protein